MVIVYYSITGNVLSFCKNIKEYPVYHISEYNDIMGSFILITPTTGFGNVPDDISNFLNKHAYNLVGVAGSGNRNWGSSYCKAVNTIADKFNVPILLKFELRGNQRDVKILLERVEKIGKLD